MILFLSLNYENLAKNKHNGRILPMKQKYEEILEKDEHGNVILEQHSDGFREESKYHEGKLIRQLTKYSNGIIELDHYV